MKPLFLIFLCALLTFRSCAQDPISIRGNDLIVFTTQDQRIIADTTQSYLPGLQAITARSLLQPDTLRLFISKWSVTNSKPAYFRFFKGSDTMILRCLCGNNYNRVFYNIPFQKGAYELALAHNREPMKGSRAINNKKLLNTRFKDIYVSNFPYGEEFKTLPLRDIEFQIHNVADTAQVQWIPL